MKKTLKIGKTYNVIGGSAYKTNTIKIVSNYPQLKYYQLFTSHPFYFNENLTGGLVIAGTKTFENCKISEVFEEKDFIKKTELFDFEDAYNLGLISLESVKQRFYDQSQDSIKRGNLTFSDGKVATCFALEKMGG